MSRVCAGSRVRLVATSALKPSNVLEQMVGILLESGGSMKFHLKAWDDPLHKALCGISNKRTLSNFEYLGNWITRRPDPPLLVASTLMIPGYVDANQVVAIAQFIAGIDTNIPYVLLAFAPAFEMSDLPTTSQKHAQECLKAAKSAGLQRVRIGSLQLLR